MAEEQLTRCRAVSTSTVESESDENQFNSDDPIQENKLQPNLIEGNSSRPTNLTLSHVVSPVSPMPTLINISASERSPLEENLPSSPCSENNIALNNYKSSNLEPANQTSSTNSSVLTPLSMGSPLLYQLATNGPSSIGRQIITPILTVLPSMGSVTTLQAGGQPIIFNGTRPSIVPQIINPIVAKKPTEQPHTCSSSDTTSSTLLPSPVESTRGSPRTLASLMLSEITPQYLELKAFAEEFKTKRIRLGYTQGAVGQSLAQKGYNNFAQSTISRFEQLQLSPANAAAIKQVLEKWLLDAESPDTQTSPLESPVGPLVNCRKRKKRAVFTAQTRNNLDEFFRQNPRPNRQMIENMAV